MHIYAETYNLNLQVLPVNEFPLRELYPAHTLVVTYFACKIRMCVSRMFKVAYKLYCMSCG